MLCAALSDGMRGPVDVLIDCAWIRVLCGHCQAVQSGTLTPRVRELVGVVLSHPRVSG